MGLNAVHFALGCKKCGQQLGPLVIEYIGPELESLPIPLPYTCPLFMIFVSMTLKHRQHYLTLAIHALIVAVGENRAFYNF